MQFDFFTFGGALFWEDVFFYQKWRIQRHCLTKRYRLLDSWDIRRASGSFNECQNKFIECLSSYELPKQKNKMVILLHGYLDSKNIFKPLWRKLSLTNTNIAALNYPSLFKDSEKHAQQILFFLNHIDNISEISFVTKGAGDLVLRHLLNTTPDKQEFAKNIRISNIVSINPIVKNNIFCEYLYGFKFFRWLLGPMLGDFTNKKLKHIPSLTAQINNLMIFSDSIIYKYWIRFLSIINFPIEENRPNSKKAIYINDTLFSPLNNEKVLNCVIKFINNGKI